MYTVTVVFPSDREYEFHIHDSDVAQLSKDSARDWLHEEFEELECTPSNPMGKVLILDVILNVAKYSGEQRFAQGGAWARQYAACVAVALDRAAVRVDVPGFTVG